MDYSILAKMSPGLTKRVLPSSGSQAGGQPASGLGKFLPGAEKLTGGVGSFFVDRDAMVIPLRISGPIWMNATSPS